MSPLPLSNPDRADNLPLAVAVISVTVFALSLGDALIKQSSSNFGIWQIFVLRSLIAIPVLVGLIAIKDKRALALPINLFWTLLRSLLLVTMWISYYAALPHLALSIASAAYYTLPIFIALFSSVFIGEKITRWGWMAVLLGFIGVLLILKPNNQDFNWYTLLPLLSAILYALAMILTRTRCREEHPLILSLLLNVSFVVVGSVASLAVLAAAATNQAHFLTERWLPMSMSDWMTMSALAVIILIGSIGAAVAYQSGPPSVIGIFDFGYVGFAVMWGLLLFDEIPDATTATGIALIVVSGVLSIRSAVSSDGS